MSEPKIAADSPCAVGLKAGQEYYFCTCGASSSQPFCDGSHAETDLMPLAFTAEADGEAWLCRCKRTSTPPFCDGTHRNLSSG